MMTALLLAPLVLQAVASFVDERHFHVRRGLPRWERIGHPLDTLTVAVAYAFAVLAEPGRTSLVVYALLAFASCLFVTKDEPVHRKECTPGEQWLHAVLFVLHPIVFLCYGLLWLRGQQTFMEVWLAVTVAYGLYQALYWNVYAGDRQQLLRRAR